MCALNFISLNMLWWRLKKGTGEHIYMNTSCGFFQEKTLHLSRHWAIGFQSQVLAKYLLQAASGNQWLALRLHFGSKEIYYFKNLIWKKKTTNPKTLRRQLLWKTEVLNNCVSSLACLWKTHRIFWPKNNSMDITGFHDSRHGREVSAKWSPSVSGNQNSI